MLKYVHIFPMKGQSKLSLEDYFNNPTQPSTKTQPKTENED